MRAGHGWLDHLIRAGVRYQRADGRRLAAAVTFNAFFAVFALGLLGFAVLGYIVDEPVVDQEVQRFLDEHLPRMDTEGLRAARGAAGLIALVSLPLIGLLWVDTLRSSIRAVWQIEEYPGRFAIRWAMNLFALAGLGLLLAVSLTVAFGAGALLEGLLDRVGTDETPPARWLLAATRYSLGLAVNTLLAIAVLTMLPRLRIPLRQVLPPALLITGGLELLTSLGRLVVTSAQANPAFQLVAGATGLLVFLLILNQLILFGAALTATNTRGRVRDLATGQRLPPDEARPAAPPPPRVDIQPAHSEGSGAPNGDPV
jgi:membrane protein